MAFPPSWELILHGHQDKKKDLVILTVFPKNLNGLQDPFGGRVTVKKLPLLFSFTRHKHGFCACEHGDRHTPAVRRAGCIATAQNRVEIEQTQSNVCHVLKLA